MNRVSNKLETLLSLTVVRSIYLLYLLNTTGTEVSN